VLKGLEFESYVCQLCVILIMFYFDKVWIMISYNKILDFIGIIMKHELVE